MDLTTQQLLNVLLAGKTIKLQFADKADGERLYKTISQMRSRTKQQMVNVGLDVDTDQLTRTWSGEEGDWVIELKIKPKEPRKKFTILSIED